VSRESTFSRDDAKRFYDGFGIKQDKQGFYEDAALDALIANGAFSDAGKVLEIGCGTGKFAQRLLSDHLPDSASYVGIDISETMVAIAKGRLRPWGDRAEVFLGDGDLDFHAFGTSFDRVVATYVFDLLGEEDIRNALSSAHAVMRPGGLLCAAGLTHGTGVVSRTTSGVWSWIHRMKPSLVGGCRPISLSNFISGPKWRIVHREVVVSMTVPSEVVVAQAL